MANYRAFLNIRMYDDAWACQEIELPFKPNFKDDHFSFELWHPTDGLEVVLKVVSTECRYMVDEGLFDITVQTGKATDPCGQHTNVYDHFGGKFSKKVIHEAFDRKGWVHEPFKE